MVYEGKKDCIFRANRSGDYLSDYTDSAQEIPPIRFIFIKAIGFKCYPEREKLSGSERAAVLTQSTATPRGGQWHSDPIALCGEDLFNARLDLKGLPTDKPRESAKSG
jgi:hypothetical protein